MKKRIAVLFIVCLATVLSFSLVACDNGDEGSTPVAPTFEGISVITMPTQVDYVQGDQIKLDGLKVQVTFSDGSTQDVEVTALQVSTVDMSTIGEKDVTVTYVIGEVTKETTFKINVTCKHEFVEAVDAKYLKSAATCQAKAKYYKSCSKCGAKSTETFENGEKTGHTFVNDQCSGCDLERNTEGLVFTLNTDHYVVTGYTGEAKVVRILSTYNDKPVTAIGDEAFDSTDIEGVIIPSSVTSIGENAFNGCESLIAVDIPDSVKSLGSACFCGCTRLCDVTLGKDIESIGDFAFFGCRSLPSIVIGENVTSIGSMAFMTCYALFEVYNLSSTLQIGKGLDTYGYVSYYAQVVNTSLETQSRITIDDGFITYTYENDVILLGYVGDETEITIPAGVTKINQYAFAYKEDIAKVQLSSSVKEIGEYAFYECALTSVYIPSSVLEIGYSIFSSCDKLTAINCGAASKPAGWDSDWNGSSATVQWGQNRVVDQQLIP